MNRFLVPLAAVAALAAAAPAFAAPGFNINARQDMIEQRIDMGLRNGGLTRGEAVRLRGEAREINRIERQYRVGGLQNWERRDLEKRLDLLSARIRYDRHDGDNRRADRGDRHNRF